MVVDVSESEPSWPKGFDPLNVDRLGAVRVLHLRVPGLALDLRGASVTRRGKVITVRVDP